jgi:hypothetical protein
MVDLLGAATRQKRSEIWEHGDVATLRRRVYVEQHVVVCVFQYTPAVKKWR